MDGRVAHDEGMAISLLLSGSMLYGYPAPSQQARPAVSQEVVRKVAEARGWPEPAAARFLNALLRLLHTIESE